MIKNIIFDFDGVIVDSEVLYLKHLLNILVNLIIQLKRSNFINMLEIKQLM